MDFEFVHIAASDGNTDIKITLGISFKDFWIGVRYEPLSEFAVRHKERVCTICFLPALSLRVSWARRPLL